jgi:hypothetical protein
MPFNIITYTCVMLGYLYLIIFSVGTMKSYWIIINIFLGNK